MPIVVRATGPDELPTSQEEVDARRAARIAKKTIAKKQKEKNPRAPKRSITDSMDTPAEKLWSAKERGLLAFEEIGPIPSIMPDGGVGVAPGTQGDAAFCSYLKQPKVVDRLEAEGFERAGSGAPHPWFLKKAPGVVLPADKALIRSLTDEQRAKIEEKRLAALERKKTLAK